jgi:beta-lactamase regulating signal transducer with metallopeptidase domain
VGGAFLLVSLYQYLLISSAMASVLYIVLKLASAVTLKRFSAAWHYYTYCFLSTFFLIPYPAMLSWLSNHFAKKPLSLLQNEFSPLLMTQPGFQEIRGVFEAGHAAYHHFDFLQLSLYLLPIGTLILAVTLGVKNRCLNLRLLKMCRPAEDQIVLDALSACKQQMGVTRKIPVYISNHAGTPFLKDGFSPYIVLPNIAFRHEELHYIFRHELTHLKNRDAFSKCFLLVMHMIHWYNPLLYFLRRDIDRFCELHCDENVIRSMNMEERRSYCELILKVLWRVADQRMQTTNPAFSDEKRNIKRRLSRIMENKGTNNKKRTQVLSIAMALVLMLITSASVYASSAGRSGVNHAQRFIFDDLNEAVIDETIPTVTYTQANGYDSFIFDENALVPQSTSNPNTLWSWTINGSLYNISGSSTGPALYTNYYFTNVTGKRFSLTAGSSNRLLVDLVHRGLIIQDVVSTWTIDAGTSKTVQITASDLNGYANSDNYYFRFNSSPIGNSYSVNGTFGS